jgi:hypothetical protein
MDDLDIANAAVTDSIRMPPSERVQVILGRKGMGGRRLSPFPPHTQTPRAWLERLVKAKRASTWKLAHYLSEVPWRWGDHDIECRDQALGLERGHQTYGIARARKARACAGRTFSKAGATGGLDALACRGNKVSLP